MKFSKKGRYAVVASMALIFVPVSLFSITYLIYGDRKIWPYIILLIWQFSACGAVDLVRYNVIKSEAPNCPQKMADYSPAQKAWHRERLRRLFSGKRLILLFICVCCAVFTAPIIHFVSEIFKSAPYNIQFRSAIFSIFVGVVVGILFGNFAYSKTEQFISELMVVPENTASNNGETSHEFLPPIPSPYDSKKHL